MSMRVLVPLAHGFEELEAVACIDILRRAGCHVVSASVGARNPIVGRSRIRVMADIDISDALAEWGQEWDLVVLPGGLGGVETMEACEPLMALVAARLRRGEPVAAICAAPRILEKLGLPGATPVTSHPACREDLGRFEAYTEEPVVRAGNVLTSRGPGTAVEFALACIELVCGAEAAGEVRTQIVASTPGPPARFGLTCPAWRKGTA